MPRAAHGGTQSGPWPQDFPLSVISALNLDFDLGLTWLLNLYPVNLTGCGGGVIAMATQQLWAEGEKEQNFRTETTKGFRNCHLCLFFPETNLDMLK